MSTRPFALDIIGTAGKAASAAVVGLYLLAVGTAFASDVARIPAPDEPWLRHSQKILQQAAQAPVPKWTKPEITERQREWAREIMEQTRLQQARANAPQQPVPVSEENAAQFRVFLTLGEGDNGRARFRRQVQALAGREDVVVELRGLPKDIRRIDQLITVIRSLTQDIDDAPPIDLDPKRFREASITVAPTVVFYRDGAPVARFSGSLELGWLKRQVENGRRGRLGVRGDTWLVAERDLISVMQERWARIDWEAKKAQAIENYWTQYQPTTLPKARDLRAFSINPSVVVAQDIRTPDGQLIARKGEHMNALAQIPFTGEIIAFDGRDNDQVELARRLAERARGDGLRPILLTQGLPGEPGFDSISELARAVGARVFLLDTRVTARFHLEHLPAVVRAVGDVFEVRELPPAQTLRQLAQAASGE